MYSKLTQNIINNIKLNISQLNKSITGHEMHVYESGTQYCVLALANKSTLNISATFAFNANSMRDLCLLKGFLNLVINKCQVKSSPTPLKAIAA